jgi:hypothetical protein
MEMAKTPIFLEPMNRIVTVMYKIRLTGKFCVHIIESDCNGNRRI